MNQNEFVQDGKRYVVNIKRCVCKEKNDNTYVLECKIIHRGLYEYSYIFGSDFLQKRHSNKGFFLTENAKKAITEEIKIMNELISATQLSETDDEKEKISVSYHYISSERLNFFVRLKNNNNSFNYYRFDGQTLDEMIREVNIICHLNHEDNIREIKKLENHPIYRAAKKCNDEKMMFELKVQFHEESEKDCSLLTKLFGRRILPTLSEEYDRFYIVDSSTVDCKLLTRSGYTVLHRPYFAMKNSTHGKWQLNPHTKCGVDAVSNESSTISFKDYLALFDETQNESKYKRKQ